MHFFSCPSQQKSSKIRQNSTACAHATAGNNLTDGVCTLCIVYIVCTVCTVCTHSVHTVYTYQIFTTSRRVPYDSIAIVHDAWRHPTSGARPRVVDSRSGSFYGVKFAHFVFGDSTTFSQVPDRFSTSCNSELLCKLQPYTIMATSPSTQINY